MRLPADYHLAFLWFQRLLGLGAEAPAADSYLPSCSAQLSSPATSCPRPVSALWSWPFSGPDEPVWCGGGMPILKDQVVENLEGLCFLPNRRRPEIFISSLLYKPGTLLAQMGSAVERIT